MERTMKLERFDDAMEVVRKTEESILDAGRQWAKAVGDAIPTEVPVVREVVKDAFHFTEEVLRLQREFVQGVLRAARGEQSAGTTRAVRPRVTRAVAAKRPAGRTATAPAHRAPAHHGPAAATGS